MSKLKEAASILFEATRHISELHEGGEKYFDAMDEFLKTAPEIIYEVAFENFKSDETLVLSGGFGIVIADRIDNGTLPYKPYVLFKGGLRGDNVPEVIRISGIRTGKGVFFDDTIYGGKTYFKIKKSLTHFNLERCFAIYDGSPFKRENIDSIFRYYDNFEATPNFTTYEHF